MSTEKQPMTGGLANPARTSALALGGKIEGCQHDTERAVSSARLLAGIYQGNLVSLGSTLIIPLAYISYVYCIAVSDQR